MVLKNRLKGVNFNKITLIFLFFYLGVTFFSLAIPNICLGVAFITFLAGLIFKQISFRNFDFKLYLSIISPFVLTIISVLNSNTYNAGFGYLNLRFPIIIVPLIILCVKTNREYLKTAFTILLVAAIIASFITFYNAMWYFNEDRLFHTDLTYFITAIHHPYFGIYLLLALLGTLEFNIIKNNNLKILVLVILSLAIAITTSRMVYLLYFIVASMYLYTKLSTKSFKYGIVIIGAFVTLFIISNKNILNKFTNSFDYNKSPRLKLWSNSLEVVSKTESYTFGIGMGDFYKTKKDAYFSRYYSNEAIGTYGYNPHSQPVEFYVTNGLVGVLILFLALRFYLLKLKNQNVFVYSVFLIVFLFSLVECIFNRQYGVQLYSVLIPLITNQNFKK